MCFCPHEYLGHMLHDSPEATGQAKWSCILSSRADALMLANRVTSDMCLMTAPSPLDSAIACEFMSLWMYLWLAKTSQQSKGLTALLLVCCTLYAEPAISRFSMWVHDGLEAYKGQRFFVWNYTKCSGLALNSRRHCKELCASWCKNLCRKQIKRIYIMQWLILSWLNA